MSDQPVTKVTPVTHPNQLHAVAALASLSAALAALAQGVDAERYGWGADHDGVQAWRPSVGQGAGGHGDPVAHAVTGSVRSKLARRATWTADTLAWLAARMQLGTGRPVDELATAIPRLRPSTAYQLTRWLRELDDRVREDVYVADPRTPIQGAACRACSVRLLYRTPPGLIVCLNIACVCAGDPCRCAMPVREAGVSHIWQPLVMPC